MSAQRKVGVVGMWIGGIAWFFGFLPIAITIVMLLVFGHGSRYVGHGGHPELLVMIPMLAVLLTPIGIVFGILGGIVLIGSAVIYVVAANKESTLI